MTKKLLGAQRRSVWIVCSRELKFERDWNAWNQGQFWQVLGLFSSHCFPFLPSFLCFLAYKVFAKAYIQALPTTLVQDTHSSCKQSFFLPSKPLPVTLVQDTFFSQASFFLPSKPLPSALVQDTHSSCKKTSHAAQNLENLDCHYLSPWLQKSSWSLIIRYTISWQTLEKIAQS
jgi:hypothetical protein